MKVRSFHAGSSYRLRMRLVIVLFALIATAVLGRAIQIQLIGDQRLERLAKRQFNSKVLIRPRRGMIFDRNGEALAVNGEVYSLAANPEKGQNKEWVAKQLSRITRTSRKKLLSRLRSNREFIWIKRHLSESSFKSLKKLGLLDSNEELI